MSYPQAASRLRRVTRPASPRRVPGAMHPMWGTLKLRSNASNSATPPCVSCAWTKCTLYKRRRAANLLRPAAASWWHNARQFHVTSETGARVSSLRSLPACGVGASPVGRYPEGDAGGRRIACGASGGLGTWLHHRARCLPSLSCMSFVLGHDLIGSCTLTVAAGPVTRTTRAAPGRARLPPPAPPR